MLDEMDKEQLIAWLLQGDVSLQYQVLRDLLGQDRKELQKRIATEGWGKRFLSKRKANGHWGQKFYQPKWTSTHYTLMDLRNLCITPDHPLIRNTIALILQTEKAKDGGILPIGKEQLTDLCINGMFLNYASYFRAEEADLHSVVDCILGQIMPDGGFNCCSAWEKVRHSSLHTTISVLEGLTEFEKIGYTYRLPEIQNAKKSAVEFILMHQLFLSDRTGEVINKAFLKLSYPSRWRYDILRALDYFQYAGVKWDERMLPALKVLLKKRNKDQSWNVQAKHPGQLHFEMEKAGKPSRWNTLRALRVLSYYQARGLNAIQKERIKINRI